MSDTNGETFGTYQRVYLGFRIVKGNRVYAWADVDDVPTSGVVTAFYPEKKLSVRGAAVGGIYTFTWGNAEHTKFYSTGQYGPAFAGMLPNGNTVAALQAAHEAAYEAYAAQQEEKKAGQEDYIARVLAPLKAVYGAASPYERRAIEILVLEELRRK